MKKIEMLDGESGLCYALNVASNHVTKAVTAPESFSGIFMPVFYGGSARNSLRVITPRFFRSVLRLPPPIGLLKSSLVGVLKRFTKGAFKMDNYAIYRRVCADLGKNPVSETKFIEIQSRATEKPSEQALIDAMRVLGVETCEKIVNATLTVMKGTNND